MLTGQIRNRFDARYADPASDEPMADSIEQNGSAARIGIRLTFLKPQCCRKDSRVVNWKRVRRNSVMEFDCLAVFPNEQTANCSLTTLGELASNRASPIADGPGVRDPAI